MREEQQHDVVRRDARSGSYAQVGSVSQRLTLERQLDGGVRDRVRGLGMEAERKRKEHTTELLHFRTPVDDSHLSAHTHTNSSLANGNGTKRAATGRTRRDETSTAAVSAPLQAPRPRLAVIPAPPAMSADEARRRIVHLLAVRSQNDLAIRAACKSALSADVSACLEEVANMDQALGLYVLKHEELMQVKPEQWYGYSSEERAQVRDRQERARLDVPIRTAEEYEAAKRIFEAQYERYRSLHAQLIANQAHFDGLQREWHATEESGARRVLAERIEGDYAERAARTEAAKSDYHTLHVHIASLKSRMRTYLATTASSTTITSSSSAPHAV